MCKGQVVRGAKGEGMQSMWNEKPPGWQERPAPGHLQAGLGHRSLPPK